MVAENVEPKDAKKTAKPKATEAAAAPKVAPVAKPASAARFFQAPGK